MAAGAGTSSVKAGATSDRAQVLAAIAKYGPSVDAMARKRYGISGVALLAKLSQGESGAISDPSAAKGKVSSAGARGWTQFVSSSRRIAIEKFGVDPWRSPDEAFHAASLHLRGKINGSTGLEGFNPGSASYPSYILNQKVGDIHGQTAGRGAASSSGSSSSAAATTAVAATEPLGAAFDAGSAGSLSSLLAGVQQQQAPVISGSLPTMPAFAAAPPLPQGYQAPASGGGPQPAQEQLQEPALSDLSLPAAPEATAATENTATSSSSSSGSSSAGGGFSASYPTAKKGKIIGTPNAGTHTLGNWQSDNAVDIGVKVGTPMVAMDDGVIVKVRHHPQNGGRFAGDQITVRGADGNMYFYAHGKSSVKAGQKVKAGQELGTTGSANGVAHLHFGVEKGDPRKIIGQGR